MAEWASHSLNNLWIVWNWKSHLTVPSSWEEEVVGFVISYEKFFLKNKDVLSLILVFCFWISEVYQSDAGGDSNVDFIQNHILNFTEVNDVGI